MSSRNVSVVRGFNDALAQGDMGGMLNFLDPQLEWRAPESVPWGGTFHGHDGFREFVRDAAQGVQFSREPVSVGRLRLLFARESRNHLSKRSR